MEIPKEIIDQLANEVYKEMSEQAEKAGKSLTLDDIESAMLHYRQKIGEMLIQGMLDKRIAELKDQKKTVRNAVGEVRSKGTKRKRS